MSGSWCPTIVTMSGTTTVAAIDAADVVAHDPHERDPMEFAGVRRLWDFESSTGFDAMLSEVEPFMPSAVRAIYRMEAPPTVVGAAAQRLVDSEPMGEQMVLFSHDQFRLFQQAVLAAVGQADFGSYVDYVEDLEQLGQVTANGDFIAIIA